MTRRPLLLSLACVVVLACTPAREAPSIDTTDAVVTDSAREREAEARILVMLPRHGETYVSVRASRQTAAVCGLVLTKEGANPAESQRLVLMGETLFLERTTPPDDFTYALAQC